MADILDPDDDDLDDAPWQPPALQTCPACGAEQGVMILYGYPGTDAQTAADQGRLTLGGCMLSRGAPVWDCRACGHEWGELEFEILTDE